MSNKLYLKNARLSFTAQLFEAKQVQGQGEAKFSCASIVEPSTQAFFGDKNPDSPAGQQAGYKWGDPKAEATKAMFHAAGACSKWKGKEEEVLKALKAADRLFLHDGDTKSEIPGYKGNFFINASNKIAPSVVDERGEKVAASSGKIYPGCYAYVTLEVWPQDNQFGKRVNASLLMVMFSKNGERLAGGSVASSDDYAAIPADVAAAVATSGEGAKALF